MCASSRAETAASTFASNSALSSCSVLSVVITLLSKYSVLLEVITHSVEYNSTLCLPHFDSAIVNETSGIPGASPSKIDISLNDTSIGVDIQSPPSGWHIVASSFADNPRDTLTSSPASMSADT